MSQSPNIITNDKNDLNEHEKNIVNLINQLADLAGKEDTTKETIDKVLVGIKENTDENINAEMLKKKNPHIHPIFPSDDISDGLRNMIRGNALGEIEKPSNSAKNQIVNDILFFTRIREVKTPCKAHPTDAGIDFFVPDAKAWTDEFKKSVIEYSKNVVVDGKDGVWFEDDNKLVVGVNAHVAIPSGIKTIIPNGLAMMMVNKSGVATKMKLDHSACLIDSSYRDELIFCFFNHGVEPVTVEPGMKITQGLIVPVINLNMQEVLNCVYDDIGKDENRGGGFGSSGI